MVVRREERRARRIGLIASQEQAVSNRDNVTQFKQGFESLLAEPN